MKKTALFLLPLCLVAFSLTGCGSSEPTTQPEEFGQAPTEEPQFGTVQMGGDEGIKAPTK